MKVQIGIFKFTGIMGQDLVHPYLPYFVITQCAMPTKIDDVILILSPALYCDFGRCGSQGFALWHYNVVFFISLFKLRLLDH